jgi:hypothetical protein
LWVTSPENTCPATAFFESIVWSLRTCTIVPAGMDPSPGWPDTKDASATAVNRIAFVRLISIVLLHDVDEILEAGRWNLFV